MGTSEERNDISRRAFIKKSLALTTSVALSGFPAIIARRSLAQESTTWGEGGGKIHEVLPGYQPRKILDIHCYGALSIWENFWVQMGGGTPNWHGFETEMEATRWLCPPNVSERPLSEGVIDFGTDSLGNPIAWGPATKPLWDPAIMNRTRMIVQKHDFPDLPIHEAAAPYAVTGTRFGNPRHAGTGAAVQRRQWVLDRSRKIPHSYVLNTGDPNGSEFLYASAVAIGQHRGNARPLLVKVDNLAALTSRLQREGMRENRDKLLDALRGQYRDRLRYRGEGEPVRSRGFSSYDAAVDGVYIAPDLIDLVSGATVETTPFCLKRAGSPDPMDEPNRPAAAIDLARQLLTNPSAPASYVMVVDTGIKGLINNDDQPCYDTHASLVSDASEHISATSGNLFNLLNHLSLAIDPTGRDPNKINLDDTLVVINSEFTRETEKNDGKGREHSTEGWAAVLIGGPILSSGKGIAGGINNVGAAPDGHYFLPADLRGAILLAAGIWPFEPELFGVSESGPSINEDGEISNARNLRQKILGF